MRNYLAMILVSLAFFATCVAGCDRLTQAVESVEPFLPGARGLSIQKQVVMRRGGESIVITKPLLKVSPMRGMESDKDYAEDLAKACAVWNRAFSDFDVIHYGSDGPGRPILCGYIPPQPTQGGGAIVGQAFLDLDPRMIGIVSSLSDKRQMRVEVMAHEIGHQLGVEHVEQGQSLMFWSTNGAMVPNRFDMGAVFDAIRKEF
jgi:Matrixin